MFRTSIARSAVRASGNVARNQVRCASTHAISNPTLVDIEKRWEGMPPQEQAELWMSLRDRMKINWAELTLQEKKAGTFNTLSGTIWVLYMGVLGWEEVFG